MGWIAPALLPRPKHQGCVPAVEILVNVPAVASLIREGKTRQIASVMQTGRAHGMMTFENAVRDLIQKGLISREDGMAFLRRAGKQLTSMPAPGPRVTSPSIN